MLKKRIYKLVAFFVSTSIIIYLMNFIFVPPMSDHWANHDRKINEDNIDTVFIGDSLGMNSIQPSIYDMNFQTVSYNACTACQDFSDSYFLLLDYIKSFPKIRNVILMLDYYNFSAELNYGMSSRIVQFNRIKSPYLKAKYVYDICSINDWYNILVRKSLYKISPTDVVKNVKVKTSSQYRNYEKLYDEESFYYDKGYICTYMTNQKKEETEYDVSAINVKSFETFKKIIELCKEKNISLSIIHSPMTSYRMSLLMNYDVLYKKVKETCDLFQIEYYDFNYSSNKMKLDDTNDFVDNSHLNYYGSCKFMTALCKVM